jgi:ketosteroid isomerase-like protein
MDSLAARGEPNGARADSANLRVVKAAFRAFTDEGVMAGLEALLEHADEHCEFRPYTARTRVLRGPGEARSFFRGMLDEGVEMTLRSMSFHESDDSVVVNGSMRVARPTGGFSESQLSWTYRFREGKLVEASWGPRQVG